MNCIASQSNLVMKMNSNLVRTISFDNIEFCIWALTVNTYRISKSIRSFIIISEAMQCVFRQAKFHERFGNFIVITDEADAEMKRRQL